MARQSELPSHHFTPEQQGGELRIAERVRPTVHLSYEPRLATDGHTLEYTNLEVRYQEETVRPGRRGNVVVGRTKPDVLRVDGTFAILDAIPIEGESDVYALEVHLDADALAKGGIDKYRALPWGLTYAEQDKVNEARREGALTTYLQSRMPNNFEVDVLNSVMGDNREEWGYREVERNGVRNNIFPSPEQQAENEQAFAQELQKKWISLKTTIPSDRNIAERYVRRLNSSLVRNAIQTLQALKPKK